MANHETVVFTQQMSAVTLDFDITADEDDVDYLTGVIVKPYTNFQFAYNAPEDFAIVWQDGVPQFESGNIYEINFRCLWIDDPSGNIIISAKWSQVA